MSGAEPISITVFTADDHPIFRRVLCEIIEEEDDLRLAGQASDGKEALEQVLALQPDVAILDVDMPGMSGLEAAREFADPTVPPPAPYRWRPNARRIPAPPVRSAPPSIAAHQCPRESRVSCGGKPSDPHVR